MQDKSIKKYLSEIGRAGGKSKSPAKLAAIAENAKQPRPGRRIPDEELTDKQRKQREYAARRKAKLEAEKK